MHSCIWIDWHGDQQGSSLPNGFLVVALLILQDKLGRRPIAVLYVHHFPKLLQSIVNKGLNIWVEHQLSHTNLQKCSCIHDLPGVGKVKHSWQLDPNHEFTFCCTTKAHSNELNKCWNKHKKYTANTEMKLGLGKPYVQKPTAMNSTTLKQAKNYKANTEMKLGFDKP